MIKRNEIEQKINETLNERAKNISLSDEHFEIMKRNVNYWKNRTKTMIRTINFWYTYNEVGGNLWQRL